MRKLFNLTTKERLNLRIPLERGAQNVIWFRYLLGTCVWAYTRTKHGTFKCKISTRKDKHAGHACSNNHMPHHVRTTGAQQTGCTAPAHVRTCLGAYPTELVCLRSSSVPLACDQCARNVQPVQQLQAICASNSSVSPFGLFFFPFFLFFYGFYNKGLLQKFLCV